MLHGAQAQDAAATPSSAGTPVASAGEDSARPAPAADSSPSGTSTASAGPPVVCFKFTLQCFGNNSSQQSDGHSSQRAAASERTAGANASSNTKDSSSTRGETAASATAAPGSLNLTPPDVRTIVSPQELQEPLPTQEQQAQESESATVEVQSDPDTPDVPGGFGALWWALRHPTQAWRIFTPVE